MGQITGNDMILNLLVGYSPTDYEPIACGKTCSITTTQKQLSATTRGSGIWDEYKAVGMGWTLSADGVCATDNWPVWKLRQLQFSLTPIYCQFVESTDLGDVYYNGYAQISSIQETGTANDLATFSIQMQGTGVLQIDGFYPLGLRIINIQNDVPSPGQTTLTLDFIEPIPAAPSYTIRIRDTDTNVSSFSSGGAAPRYVIINTNGHYAISIASEGYSAVIGTGVVSSEFSPEIYYP